MFRWRRVPLRTGVASATPVLQWCGRSVSSFGEQPSNKAATMQFGIDPAKLDLKLDLGSMDFNQVAAATMDAMNKDRSQGRVQGRVLPSVPEAGGEAPEEVAGHMSNVPDAEVADPQYPPRQATPYHSDGAPSPRTVRGIVGAGDVHDANTPAAAYAQRRAEQQQQQDGRGPWQERDGRHGGWEAGGNRRSPGVRYTLMDTLRDCAMSGNWLRAFKQFEGAVEKAHTMVVSAPKGGTSSANASIPARESNDQRGGTASRGETSSPSINPSKEAELFRTLTKLSAALPPRPSSPLDRSSNVARRKAMDNMVGIMRWGGGHYYILMKMLLDAERIDEARRVWTVMKDIGFVRYQMEERTFNALVGLMRRTARMEGSAEQMVTPIVAANRVVEQLEKDKAFKRQVILELEAISREQGIHLRGANSRTATIARIAQAMHDQETPAGHQAEGLAEPDVRTNSSVDSGTAQQELRVGDFNGLLRMSQSHEGTLRILSMMEKLGVEKDSQTYANIIAAHKNPRYLVEGATVEEVEQNTPTSTPASIQDEDGEELVPPSASHPTGSALTEESKMAYEAYKDKRILSARQWFDMVPAADRTANLFNEMLYLLRANSSTAQFDEMLTQFRGNAIRTEDQWDSVEKANQSHRQEVAALTAGNECPSGTSAEAALSSGSTATVPVILAASWSVPPNGRTYELLIRRCRYRYDWQGMWELFGEMRESNTRGTPKLYQLLMDTAKMHPPASVNHRGDISAFIMELYSEMRRNKVDVSSVNSTLNLVNAWSDTRRKRRRWL